METQKYLKQISTGIVRWIPIRKSSNILIIETGRDDYMYESRSAVEQWLIESGYSVERCDGQFITQADDSTGFGYDLALLLGGLETCKDQNAILKTAKSLVRSGGRMFLACGNRFALKGFCGDQDPFTDNIYDGIEGYASVSAVNWKYMDGRLYSDKEIRRFLYDSGWRVRRRFSVFPDIRYPQYMFANGIMPNEQLESRLFPIYNHPDSLWVPETKIIDQIAEGGMLHQMADGYLYECVADGTDAIDGLIDHQYDEVVSVTLSLDRSRDKAYATMISGEKVVQKKALFSEGVEGLKRLKENHESLMKRGISAVDVELLGDSCFMPYLVGENGMKYFSRLADEGKEPFLEALDKFVKIIKNSSDYVKDEQNRDVLAQGFVDLVPINAFVLDGEFTFFDQEFVIPMCPAELIISRTLTLIRGLGLKISELISDDELYARYNLPPYGGSFTIMADKWHNELTNRKHLGDFRRAHSVDWALITANRHRSNFSTKEYDLKFVDIFRSWERMDLYVFGSGKFAERFMKQYADRYVIKALVDNDVTKQGKCVKGIKVIAPTEIPVTDRTRVIICVKHFRMIFKQLQSIGVTDICIYDPYVDIRDPKRETEQEQREVVITISEGGNKREEETISSAKYHIGYVSGVFDMFHVGHLNLLERAKAMCDYLIVEVVSDEAVRRDKNVEPTIPLEDRIRIVQSIKFVDEVHEIPIDTPSTADAWRRYHFDAQFRGSDYADNEGSKDDREFLRKHGAELVIFPYTEKVSSTKLRSLIEKK